jgi:RNA polymerase sigma factor (sigma-70 family)
MYPGRLIIKPTPHREGTMWSEDGLYQKWRDALGAEQKTLESLLFEAVERHVRIAVWQRLHESNPDVTQEIFSAVNRNMLRFKGESKFSTWVNAIAKYKVAEEIRRRRRHRKLFNDSVDVFDKFNEDLWQYQPDFTDGIAIDELAKGLSGDEQLILWGKRDQFTDKEIGERLDMTEDAVESKWRRLKKRMRTK